MAGNEDAFDFDAVNVQNLPVPQQRFRIENRYLRQLVEVIDDSAAHLAGEIPVLDFPHIQPGVPEQSRTVRLHSANMVGILMGVSKAN